MPIEELKTPKIISETDGGAAPKVKSLLPKVLLFLSRETLTPQQREIMSGLNPTDSDLDVIIRHCIERLIAPVAITHLKEFWGDRHEDRALHWKEIGRTSMMTSMLINSEMLHFHKTCVHGVSRTHLYFKGPSLATEYYEQPHVRQCRDIDVLVPKADVREVVDTALAHGYWIDNDEYAQAASRGEEALSAYVEMKEVAFLRSKRGVAIEVHGSLDRKSGLFLPEFLFQHSKDIDFFGQPVRVLDEELLFCYVAYHATEHTWSRLNWFSDVHAILNSETFDREVCLEWARHLGIVDLVESTIEIDDWCSRGAPTPLPNGEGARKLYRLFLANIFGGLDSESELKRLSTRIGLPDRFQATGHARLRAFFNNVRATAFSPNFSLYCRFPLSRRLWWMYTVLRPVDSAIRRVFGFLRRVGGRTDEA